MILHVYVFKLIEQCDLLGSYMCLLITSIYSASCCNTIHIVIYAFSLTFSILRSMEDQCYVYMYVCDIDEHLTIVMCSLCTYTLRYIL